MDHIFRNIGRTAAAILGRRYELTLKDGTPVTVKAIWDPARREAEIGEYGAVFESFELQLHISRDSWLPHGRETRDLERAKVDIDGNTYTLIGPRDDGKSIIKLSAHLT